MNTHDIDQLIDKIEASAPMDIAGRSKHIHDLRAALQSQDREDVERMDFISVEANVGSSLVSDDNGKWAFTDSGIAPVVANGQGFTETVGITAIVDPGMWKDSPRGAIDHARRIEGGGDAI